jgi:HSP20 family molecular chaperone IbpA
MSRLPPFGSPLLLGFDDIERFLDRAGKAADGYPPYNIERFDNAEGQPERLRITLAVAGFAAADLAVQVEDRLLTVAGRQSEPGKGEFLHKGIATRPFQRSFALADGIAIDSATLKEGLLAIDLVLPQPKREVRAIAIRDLG